MINFTRLRLQGFKSFVDRTDLEITTGLTGIVGPNGCGKSNLVEALSWVMGENSAKRLRGTGMEDVIFNGTANRPARNSAEVSVMLDNTARTAPAIFNNSDEIEVVRRIERDMGSSYYINGKPVRARDVQMLFADTNVGAHSTAIVSQGKITQIINAKPSERRQILEESAGISGLYARRHEAELRLRAADNNLVRLQDVVAGLESQLDALKRQSRQATRYKNISTEIRTLETLLALAEWFQAQEVKAQSGAAAQAAEVQVAEHMTTVAQLEKTQITQSQAIPPLRDEQAVTAAAWQTQNFALQRINDEGERINAQIEEAKEVLSNIANDKAHETQTSEENEAVVARLEAEESELKARLGTAEQLQRLEELRDSKEKAAEELEAIYQESVEESAKLRASRKAVMDRLQQDENRLNGLQSRIASLKEQIERKKAERSDIVSLDSLRQETETLEQEQTGRKEQEETFRATLEAARAALEEARQDTQNAREAEGKIKAEINALESVLNFASEEGFRPVLEDIKADEGFEAALSKALGDTLMASTDSDAPVVWTTNAGSNNAPSFPGNVRAILPHIKAPDALKTALSYIGFVDQESDGHDAARNLQPGQSIVSRDGAYWRWDGLYIKAKAADRHAIRLKNKNRFEELQKQHPEAAERKEQAETALKAAQEKVEIARLALVELENTVRQADRDLTQKRQNLQRALSQQASLEAELAKTEEGLSILQDDSERLQQDVAAHRAAMESFDDQAMERQQADVDAKREALNTAQDELREAATEYQIYQQDLSRREARMRAIADERINLQNRTIRARERLKQLEERQAQATQKLEELKNRPSEIEAQREALLTNLSELERKKDIAADALAKAESELDETVKALKIAEAAMMETREARAHAQAMVQGAEGSLEVLRQSIADQFSTTPEDLWEQASITQEKLKEESIDKLRGKRDRLIRERDGMGPVNLRADVEGEEVDQQLAKLLQERNDLSQAIEELRQGIQKLNKEARERLVQAFESVNEHFKVLFTRLFGGGQAHLAFIESEDPLEAALEVYAQPPGKSLQSLSLLSGGEKTLASTALIFAMFLTNPAPICVLDEIDAPLDDANVDRVCSMLEEIVEKSKTRFLMITHHRLTMARMNRLYGVTMSERGVSQLVSVDFQKQLDFLEAAE